MSFMNKLMRMKDGGSSEVMFDKKYCLLETVSLLKYKAYQLNKEGFSEEADILNIIGLLRDLSGKSMYISEHTSLDDIMQLNFELGIFYKEFAILCKNLNLYNPLENLNTKDIWVELSVLNEIDIDYFSESKVKKIDSTDKIDYQDLEIKMYDTLFYLREHFIFNYDEKLTDIHQLNNLIDKYLLELESLLKKRSKSNISTENENISFRLGKVVEALDTIAYDYDLPSELSSSFLENVSDFYITLSKVLLELNKNNINKEEIQSIKIETIEETTETEIEKY